MTQHSQKYLDAIANESPEMKRLREEWAFARAAEDAVHLQPRDNRPQTVDDYLDQHPLAEFKENE